jgi:Mycoplasma protein of unknown function, DUF285
MSSSAYCDTVLTRYSLTSPNRCTKNVKYFDYIFAWYDTFNEPLTYWNTSSAISTAYMFWEARSFDQNLSHFDMSKVTAANHMFKYATKFRGIGVERWDMGQNEVRNERLRLLSNQ